MNEETPDKKINILQTIAFFAPLVAYALLMDYLHYAFLDWHPEILGYYYRENCLIPCCLILFFFSARIFVVKSLFFKKLNRAANCAIWIFLAFVFVFYSFCAFDSGHLTESGVKGYIDFPAGAFAEVKIGITKMRSKSGASYDQYIEIYMIREKAPFTFNTFQNDYTIADFYDTYNGRLFFDGIETMPVEIEVFGAENVDGYLDGNRLITADAAFRLRKFFSERSENAN